MTDLSSTGSIATHIVECIPVSTAVSGNMIEIVDIARQHVANFCGVDIPTSNIPAKYIPAIVDFAKAEALDLQQADQGGESIRLGDLSISESNNDFSSKQYQMMGEAKLNALGRRVRFSKSLS